MKEHFLRNAFDISGKVARQFKCFYNPHFSKCFSRAFLDSQAENYYTCFLTLSAIMLSLCHAVQQVSSLHLVLSDVYEVSYPASLYLL